MKCTSLIIYLEGVTVPLLGNDWEEREYALQNLHPGKASYNGKPAARHTGDMQSLVSFVVVIIQVETGGMQKELVSLFHFSDGRQEWSGCAGKVKIHAPSLFHRSRSCGGLFPYRN